MSAIEFKSVDDLLTFLVYCEREGTPLASRDDYDWILTAPASKEKPWPRFAVTYADEKWPEDKVEACQFNGVVTPTLSNEWGRLHINELLLRLPLLPRPSLHGHVGALLLMARRQSGGADKRSDQDLAKDLYEAWHRIPKQEGSRSEFRFCRNPGAWFSVEILDIAGGFDFGDFRDSLPATVAAYVPAWHASEIDCPLYVQDGFRHCRPVEFGILYDDSVWVDRSLSVPQNGNFRYQGRDFKHLAIAEAHAAGHGGKATEVRPQVYLLGAPELAEDGTLFRQFSRADEIYALSEIETAGRVEKLDALPMGDDYPFQLELGIDHVKSSLGVLHEMETRIGQCQKELERLQSNKSRLHGFSKDEHVPIFLFHQSLQSGSLPAALDDFLRRPLAELAQYRYLRTVAGQGYDHWVISDTRMPLSNVLGTPCTDVYICQGQWWDCMLPLFVRHGYALNFEISEVGLVDKFSEFLNQYPELGNRDNAYILAEPARSDMDNGIHFRVLGTENEEIRSLDEMLTFTNPHAGGIHAMVSRAATALDQQAIDCEVKMGHELNATDMALLKLAEGVVSEAEYRWDAVRTNAQEVLLKAEIADVAVGLTENAYQNIAATWLEFIEIVGNIDKEISDVKIEALGLWHTNSRTHNEHIERLKKLHLDVDAEIKGKREALLKELADLQKTRVALENHSQELQELEKQARLERDQCKKRDEALVPLCDTVNQLVTQQQALHKKLEDDIRTAESALLNYQNLQNSCSKLREEMVLLNEKSRHSRTQLEELRLDLNATLHGAKSALDAAGADLAETEAALARGASAWLKHAERLSLHKLSEHPKNETNLQGIRERFSKIFPEITPPPKRKIFWLWKMFGRNQ